MNNDDNRVQSVSELWKADANSQYAVTRGRLFVPGCAMSEVTNYAGVDLTRHPALKEAFRIACLIERCGASQELTEASSAAFAFVKTLDEVLEDA